MSRRIATGAPLRARTPAAGHDVAPQAALGETEKPDDYVGRLAKYIPAETVAFYLAASGALPGAPDSPNVIGQWVVFGLGFVITVLYFVVVTKRQGKPPLWSQIVFPTIAYVVWVFAIGGPFKALPWYSSAVASITLMFVTTVFGLYKPDPGA